MGQVIRRNSREREIQRLLCLLQRRHSGDCTSDDRGITAKDQEKVDTIIEYWLENTASLHRHIPVKRNAILAQMSQNATRIQPLRLQSDTRVISSTEVRRRRPRNPAPLHGFPRTNRTSQLIRNSSNMPLFSRSRPHNRWSIRLHAQPLLTRHDE